MTEIGKEYGAALFMLAMEADKREEYYSALCDIAGIFVENPEYPDLISSPAISTEERLGLIDAAFSGNIPEDVLSFLKLMCEKRRIFDFADALMEYKALYDESLAVCEANVTSSVELSDEQKEKLLKKLSDISGKNVSISYHIDKSILGGITVEMDGKVMDSSLRARLRDIKEVIN